MTQALSGPGSMLSNKKQREIYVGNLTIGVVTDVMLKDLFNGALSHLVPDPVNNPPVVTVRLDPTGDRSSWLAAALLQLAAALCFVPCP